MSKIIIIGEAGLAKKCAELLVKSDLNGVLVLSTESDPVDFADIQMKEAIYPDAVKVLELDGAPLRQYRKGQFIRDTIGSKFHK